jgi:AAA domain-containing protein
MSFKVYDLAELQALPKPQMVYVIEPIVPIPGVTLLHGRFGTGKTAILMTESVAVASGKPFLGLPTKQGPVLVIEADMPDPGFRYRFWDLHQTLDPKLPIKTVVTPGFDSLHPTFKTEPLGQTLLKLNQEFKPVLVIVDTLRKTHRRDERESSTPVEVYDYWQSTFPESAIQIMAHDRKVTVNAKGTRTPDEENFSGHQGWLNDAQSALHISLTGQGTMKLEHTKSQVGELQKRLDVRLLPGGQGLELTSDTVQRSVDQIMRRMSGMPQSDINKAIANTLGVGERTARTHKRAWRQANGLEAEDDV